MAEHTSPQQLREEIARLERDVARLRRVDAQFRALVEHAADPFFLVDAEGRVRDASERAGEYLGYSRAELLRLRVDEVSALSPPEGIRRTFERLRAEGALTLADEHRRRDGSLVPVEVRLALLDAEGEPLALALVRDVTESRRARVALAESEARYRSLVEQTLDGFFVLEADTGRFVFLNQAICDLCGYTVEEGLGLTVWDVIAPEQHGAVREVFAARLAGKPRDPYRTWTVRRRDGSTFTAEITGSATTFGRGPVIQGLLRDVTERQVLWERLRQSQKLEAVGTLASGVAHDFNNILQGISGYVELLLYRPRGPEQQRDYLEQIARATERGSELVRGLLAFSRRSEPQLRPLDLNELVGHGVRLLERTIPRMITVETSAAPGLWPVRGDPVQLELALVNLGTNGRDAMPRGGRLIFETRNALVEPRTAEAHPGCYPGPYVVLGVSDEGQGMDPATAERVFEPFFTTKEVGRGTGLGLSLVHGVVRAHGGFVTCHSVLGRGTTFELYLPACVELPAAAPAPAEPAAQAGGGETVLVADDDASVLEVLQEFLESLGYRVVAARSGEEALERHAEQPVALTLLDLDMVGMGGLECLRRLRARDPLARVLVASGHATEAHAASAREAGAVGFVGKPHRLAELAARVRAALEG